MSAWIGPALVQIQVSNIAVKFILNFLEIFDFWLFK